MSSTQLKLARAEEQGSQVNEALRQTLVAKAQLELDLSTANLVAERANSLASTYKERCEQAEQKLNSRDGNLERALTTLGQVTYSCSPKRCASNHPFQFTYAEPTI